MCRFLRVTDYRDTWQAVLLETHDFELASSFVRFSASFARWRYETVHKVTAAVLALRPICEHHCRKAIWGKVQDNKLLDRFVTTCGDTKFWKWLQTFAPAFEVLEKFRTWARGCACHEDELRAGIKVKCPWMDRRLREAPDAVSRLLALLADTGTDLTLEKCEGDAAVYAEYGVFLRLVLDDVKHMWQWVFEPPYSFSMADDPDSAQMFLDYCALEEPAQHHRVTRYLCDTFGDQLARIANGDVSCIDNAFRDELAVWWGMPLVSDLAEGYHRGTKLSEVRAAAAQKPFVLATNRIVQNCDELQDHCCTEDGFAEYKRAYINASSVLRRRRSSRYCQIKRNIWSVCSEVYRLGKYSRVDWSFLADVRIPDVDADLCDGVPGVMRLIREFICAVVELDRFYTCQQSHDTAELKCFKVLRMITTVERTPWTVARNKRVKPFSFIIQEYDVWRGGPSDADRKQVFPVGDARRVDPGNLLNCMDWLHHVKVWDSAFSDVQGCWDLTNPKKNEPRVGLMDPACPTLWLGKVLQDRGFSISRAKVSHTPQSDKVYSTRRVEQKRFYLQCVLVFEDLWRQGLHCMASEELQSYYRCLLAGKMVPPGLSDRDYLDILGGKRAPPPLPPPVVPAAAPAEPSDGDSHAEEEILEPGFAFEDEFGLRANVAARGAVHATSSRSGHDSEDSSDEILGPPIPPSFVLPPLLEGSRIRRDPYRSLYDRYQVFCATHPNCSKKRNCMAGQVSHFGPWEPFAYLAVWLRKAPLYPSAQRHVFDCHPTLEEQRQWLVEKGHLQP